LLQARTKLKRNVNPCLGYESPRLWAGTVIGD